MHCNLRYCLVLALSVTLAGRAAHAQELEISDLPRTPGVFKYFQLGHHVPPRSGWTGYIGGREVIHPSIRLPLDIDPKAGEHMYCNTQVWGFKDNAQPTGKSNHLINYTFPWTSTFCERRDFPGVNQPTKLCRLDSAGRMRQSHQGSDCRPPAPKADFYWMVAVEDGVVTKAKHNEIHLVGVSGIKWKYRHGNKPRAEITPGANGISVKRGTRLAQVTDLKSTPIHLHIETERPAGTDRDNMPSLVLAYQRALGVPEDQLTKVLPNGELAFDVRYEIPEGTPVMPCAESEALPSIGTEQLFKFSSLWCHNDSIVGMVENGAERKLVYYKPKASVRDAAKRDPVIFEGAVAGANYTGQALWYSARCGDKRFEVTGSDAKTDGARWLSLKGSRASFPGTCDAPKFIEETLGFSYMREADAVVADASPAPDAGADTAPKPDSGPAPVLEPEPGVSDGTAPKPATDTVPKPAGDTAQPDSSAGVTPAPKPEPVPEPKPDAVAIPKPEPLPATDTAGISGPCAAAVSEDTLGTETWFKFTSLWCHNGSIMGGVEDGDRRTFVYLRPKPGIRDAVARNPMLFDGSLSEGSYGGTALSYSNDCGDRPFSVSGSEAVTAGVRLVTLTGERMSFPRGCAAPRPVNETLAFSFLKSVVPGAGNVTASGGTPAEVPKPDASTGVTPVETKPDLPTKPEAPIEISSCAESETEASIGTEAAHTFATLWCHNRSVMGLVVDGDKRKLVYFKPRSGIRDTAKRSPVLYEGTVVTGQYTGEAVWFSEKCGDRKFAVTGSDTKVSGADVIVLEGNRPSFGSSCDAPGSKPERLVFSFLRKTDAVVAAGDTGAPNPDGATPVPDGGSTTPLPAGADAFNLPAPQSTSGLARQRLWSTYYYVYLGKHAIEGDAVAIRDRRNDSFGAALKRVSWCKAAVEGTVRVDMVPSPDRGFNYAGRGQTQTSCSGLFGRNVDSGAVARSVWAELPADAAYGLGNHHMTRLVPFRSIAADQTGTSYKRGTVFFIPNLRGQKFTLDGRQMTHDGYVYVADVGGAIKGAHIDFFSGTQSSNPFPSMIKSSAGGTFEAFTVNDPAIKADLQALHRR